MRIARRPQAVAEQDGGSNDAHLDRDRRRVLAAFSRARRCAAEDVPATSRVDAVTVFLSGAEVTRTARLKLDKGEHTIVFSDLPAEAVPGSIRVDGKATGKLDIESVDTRRRYIAARRPGGAAGRAQEHRGRDREAARRARRWRRARRTPRRRRRRCSPISPSCPAARRGPAGRSRCRRPTGRRSWRSSPRAWRTRSARARRRGEEARPRPQDRGAGEEARRAGAGARRADRGQGVRRRRRAARSRSHRALPGAQRRAGRRATMRASRPARRPRRRGSI